MAVTLTTMPPMFSPTWSRYRRLAMTGPGNPNYRNGRYSRQRRDLELELGAMMQTLRPTRLIERVARIEASRRDQITRGLGLLTGESHPDVWAMPDRRPGKPARWYLPRVALSYAVAWLRKARELQRLIFFDRSSIESSMPRLHKERGSRGTTGARRSPADEVRRLQAWSRAHGIPWTGSSPPPES